MTWRPEWEEPQRRGFGFGRGPGGWGVARTLVVLCVVVTLVNMVLAANATPTAGGPVTLAPWLGLTLHNAVWIYPWFSYVLVHDAFGVMHVLFNCVLLWFLGIDLEQKLGRGRFLTLFFGASLLGAVAHVVALAALGGSESSALIGASGGIFGLLFFIEHDVEAGQHLGGHRHEPEDERPDARRQDLR